MPNNFSNPASVSLKKIIGKKLFATLVFQTFEILEFYPEFPMEVALSENIRIEKQKK